MPTTASSGPLRQELRLQGSALNSHLDWLVGGYYAHEDLDLTDNIEFGSQYGRFATCRIVSGGGLAPLLLADLAGLPRRPVPPCSARRRLSVYAGFDRLDSVNSVGSNYDHYSQDQPELRLLHPQHLPHHRQLDLTVGLRYTHETKDFSAAFNNNNTACPPQQAASIRSSANAGAGAAVAGALIALTCQGNSTLRAQRRSISDRRSEGEWTGTGVLSYKPTDNLLIYASYSRGYKAGGFNLDRSALQAPSSPFAASLGGAQALVRPAPVRSGDRRRLRSRRQIHRPRFTSTSPCSARISRTSS